ncbi:MAG: WG repeat-containing protein [Lachnospiraceae bacterium]|jgi:nitrate reductase NapAB chaperone NapD|nr:WG repeat-containing protein [Lachnospiraceae bacterium]
MSRGKRYDDEPKINLKKVFAVILVIAIVALIIISINKIIKDNSTPKIAMATSYVSAIQNGKWGVIKNDGQTIIPFEYEEMVVVPNSNKPVFIVTYDINETDGTYKTKVLNEKNEQIYTNFSKVEAIDNYDKTGKVWYEENVLRIENNNKYGLINLSGELILTAEYDEITSLKGIENSLLLKKEGLVGLANTSGEIIINAEYKGVESLTDEYENGYRVIKPDDKCGIISIAKTTVLEPIYEAVNYIGSTEYYGVKKDGKTIVINKATLDEIVLDGVDAVLNIYGDNIVVKKADKYGLMNKQGLEILTPIYDELVYMFEDYYIAKKDSKYGIINHLQEISVEFNYNYISYNKLGEFIMAEVSEVETAIMNKEFTIKVSGIVSEVNEEKAYLRIRVGEDYKYYNFNLEEKKNTEVLTQNTLFLSKKDGKYGYTNKEGQIVVDYKYDDATEQNKYGYVSVQMNGKWGSLDQIGKEVQSTNVDLSQNMQKNFIATWHLDTTGLYYTK